MIPYGRQEITQEEHTGGRGHETGQVRRTKFKLYNKLDALEKMGRHLGMFPNKHEHGGDPEKPLTLQVITGVPEKE